MKYNAYDFDKTIYLRDSTFDFYIYCLKRNLSIISEFPITIFYFILYLLKLSSKTVFKEKMFRFLKHVNDIDVALENFWDLHIYKMAAFYMEIKTADDIIISASPEFLLSPVCKRLGITNLIASKVDKHTGKYDGLNCHGEEKVRRLKIEMPGIIIENFYSDSLSDTPMASIADNGFLVKGGTVTSWPKK